MSALRKLERDHAEADLAAVRSMLSQLSEEDVMTRFSLEERLAEIESMIATLGVEDDVETASAAIFFGGRPVLGSRGIESEFAGNAVSKFQDLVSKVLAHERGELGQRGVVPNKGASTLHITNVVRGSFGFMFEEMRPAADVSGDEEASLKVAMDETTRILHAFGEGDEDAYRSTVESIDQRVLSTAREFFDIVRQGGATLRLVAGGADRSFDASSVSRAVERATSTTVEDAEEDVPGWLTGVLPDAHQFEFNAQGERGIIRGKVHKSLTTAQLTAFNKDLVNRHAVARVSVRRVRSSGVVVRERYTLLGINPTGR